MIVFACGGLEMAGEVNTSRIASICLRNTTGSCFMSAMVEYLILHNSALGFGLSKTRASCFSVSMALSADYGKGMVK